MLKKSHNQIKAATISKLKYSLPSSNDNQFKRKEYQESRLNQIKRSISNKYKASYPSSKNTSKRPSIHQIENHTNSLNSEINFNQDVSFEIVGIRDTNQTQNQTQNFHSKYNKYPLNDSNRHSTNFNDSKSKISGQNLTFRNQQEKKDSFLQSSIDRICKNKDFEKFTKNFPKPEEKRQFECFLQTLKNDENYQNTITIFTIMYFYEQKSQKK